MKKSKRALLATVLISLGAGVSKLIHDHPAIKSHVKDIVKKHFKHPIEINGLDHNLNKAYNRLKSVQKSDIDGIVNHIVPFVSHDSYRCQKEIHQYYKILKYTSNCHKLHSKDVATSLDISPQRTAQLIIALSMQGLLEHTKAGTNYVRKNDVNKFLNILTDDLDFKKMVDVDEFIKLLKNLSANYKYN